MSEGNENEAEALTRPSDADDDEEDTEQIVFKDEALESTQAALKQATEERDQLKETIELQKKEIATLRGLSDNAGQLDALRDSIASKDKEIAELRTSTACTDNETEKALRAQIEKLINDIGEKDEKIVTLEKLRQDDATSSATKLESLEKQNSTLKTQLADAVADASTTSSKLMSEIESFKNQIATLHAEHKASKAKDKADMELMRLELESLRARNEKESEATIDSGESAVKIVKPAVSKLSVDDDEEDDWGDDWD